MDQTEIRTRAPESPVRFFFLPTQLTGYRRSNPADRYTEQKTADENCKSLRPTPFAYTIFFLSRPTTN